MSIINCSFLESRLPPSWKEADIVPIPKHKPVNDVNKDLRPISLTPVLSKVAEEYVVGCFVKPAVLKKVDPQQFGTLPGLNTTYMLLSPSRRREAPCEGTNSPRLFTPGETKALAESKVHQISRAWVTVRVSVGGHPH